jgi:Uma2 family endonuclease
MSATATNWLELVEQLPSDAEIKLHNVSWEDYEELLEQVGEARGLRISYDEGTLTIMTLSLEHENYAEFISGLVRLLSVRLRINIRFFGSATLRRSRREKGNEPDACFYVQSAPLIGNRIKLDFTKDPPPDIAVEVDVHHGSDDKLSIYAGLGVPEVWRYDGEKLTIKLLEDGNYVEAEQSRALPMLSAESLTDFLRRLREEGEFQAIVAFDEWLQAHRQ